MALQASLSSFLLCRKSKSLVLNPHDSTNLLAKRVNRSADPFENTVAIVTCENLERYEIRALDDRMASSKCGEINSALLVERIVVKNLSDFI